MKQTKKIVIILVVALGLSEAMLRVFFKPVVPPPLFDVSTMPSVQATPWFAQWQQEHSQMRRRFRAYELYALEPFKGEHLNINERGYRKTENPALPRAGRTDISLFGGSTMWGGLSRDSHTIASQLSRNLNAAGTPTHVRNYGQVGFVFSQEVHQALRIAYAEEAPEVMLFMDGVCDVLAALANFVNGVDDPAGKPWEYDKYAHLFQLGKTGEVSWFDVAKKSMLVRRLAKMAEKQGWVESDGKNQYVSPSSADRDDLGEAVADQYVRVLRTAHRAFKGIGVRPVFVLQPAIFDKDVLSDEEQIALKKNAHWQEYVSTAYQKIKTRSRALPADLEFWDLSGVFKGNPETLYADIMHYSEAGNAVIAKEIARRLQTKVPADSIL